MYIYIYTLNLRWAKGCSSNDSRPHSPAPEELSTFQTGEAKRVQKQSLNRGPSTWPCRCIACALGSLPQSYNILDLQSKSFVSLQLRILELAVGIREQTPGYWNRSNLINTNQLATAQITKQNQDHSLRRRILRPSTLPKPAQPKRN